MQGAFLGCIYVPAALLFFTSLPAAVLRYAPPIFVLLSLSAATVGTVIGASVADAFGGGSVFVPGCLATLVTALAIALSVRASDAPQRALRLDGIGLALSIAAFGAMQFLANDAERRNWFDDPGVVVAACVLAVALPSYILYEVFFTREPHVDFRMFVRYRNLAVGGVISVTIGFVGYATTLFIGYLQTVLGATPTDAGAAILVRVLTYVIGVPAAFLLVSRKVLDLRVVVTIGAIGSALALAAFSRSMTTTADLGAFVGVSLVFGVFFGLMNQPMGNLVIGSMPLNLLAAGVSIYKLSSPVGTMIGTAIVQTLLYHRLIAIRSAIVGRVTVGNAAVNAYVRAHGGAAALGGLVAAQAVAIVVLAVIPVVLFVRLAPPAPPASTRTGERRSRNGAARVMPMFEQILVVVDGSPTSTFAVDASLTLSREDRSPLIFCVCVDPELCASNEMAAFGELAVGYAQALLDDALARARAAGLNDATGVIVRDDPKRAIVALALERGAGVIMLGVARRASDFCAPLCAVSHTKS